MKIDKLYVILSNRKPIIINTGYEDNKAILIFSDTRLAEEYISKRSTREDIDIIQWSVNDLIGFIEPIKDHLDKWGVLWVVMDHLGVTSPTAMHLKISDILDIKEGRFKIV